MTPQTNVVGPRSVIILACALLLAPAVFLAAGALATSPTATQAETTSCGDPICFEAGHNLEVTRSGASDLVLFDRGGEDALVRVHQWGTVAAMTMDGQDLWERQHRSLRMDWGLLGDHLPPRISMGPVSDPGKDYGGDHHTGSPVATEDLTGDGVEDIFVAHNWVRDDRPFIYGIVSLFDGTDGRMLWHETYRGVIAGIALTGGTLVIAEENGEPPYGAISTGEPDGRSALHGLTVQSGQDGIEATEAWRLDQPQADWGLWTGPTVAGDGRVAIALTLDAAPRSTVSLLDAASGDILWSSQRQGVVDFVRYDDHRDEVVFTQTLPEAGAGVDGRSVYAAGNGFIVVAAATTDGSVRMTHPVQGSGTPQGLAVADATGDGVPDPIVTGQHVPAPTARHVFFTNTHPPPPARSSVTLIDGATGAPLWQRTTGAMGLPGPAWQAEAFLPANPSNITGAYGIAAADGVVVVSSADTAIGPIDNRHLQAFDALTGLPLWSVTGKDATAPSSLLVHHADGNASVMGISLEGRYQAYDPDEGTVSTSSALLVDVHHAVATDVTGDGVDDLVVGAKSGGVFALGHSAALPRDNPSFLWKTDLDGPIHDMVVADLTGDGEDELVIAAEDEVAVLHAGTGARHLQIPYPDAFVWTVTVGDVDHDGSNDIIVPTDGLDAYRGSDGSQLWAYGPTTAPGERAHFSNAALVGDTVVAQYSMQWQPGIDHASNLAEGARLFPFGSIPHRSAVVGLDAGSGGEVWARDIPQDEGFAALWNSVSPAPAWPGTDGQAVAVVNHPDDVAMGSLLGRDTIVRLMDAETGTDILSDPIGPSSHRLGVKVLAGDKLVAFGGSGLHEITPDGFRELPTYSSWGVDIGSFGTHGELAVSSGAYSAFVVDPDAEEDADAFMGRGRTGLALGDTIAADLDGDQVDEVIAFFPDRDLYTQLTLAQGAPGYGVGVSPYGISVLSVADEAPTADGTGTTQEGGA